MERAQESLSYNHTCIAMSSFYLCEFLLRLAYILPHMQSKNCGFIGWRKSHSGFPIRCYGKTGTTFLDNPKLRRYVYLAVVGEGVDLTEAEDIKKGWQEYTEELCKKDLHDPDNHDGMITHLEPDIPECEVKWALGSITTNKASGGDGIPIELFQILKDNAVKVLRSICQ